MPRQIAKLRLARQRVNRTQSGRQHLIQLSVLTNIGLFAVINILLVALVHLDSARTESVFKAFHILHTFIWTNAAAAIAAAVAAPFLLSAFERMQQRLTRQNNELRSLHAIDTAISAELNIGTILQVAVRHATLAVDGEFGGLWLFGDGDRRDTIAQAFYGIPGQLQALVTEYVIDRAAASPRRADAPFRTRDVEFTWTEDHTAAALKLSSVITVPIKQQENVLGVLMVANRSETFHAQRGFSAEDEELLSAVATTVAVAVQNSRLYEETEKRGAMLRSLVARIGDAISASSDAPQLMQVLADEAARILSCARVAVYEFDNAQEQFLPLAAIDDPRSGRGATDLFFRQPLDMDIMLPPEAEGPSSSIDRYVPNVRDTLGLGSDIGQFLNRPGFLYVMRSREHDCIGLLCMLDNTPRPHSEETWMFANALASQAAVALENSRLAGQTHRLLAQARALQDATNKIAAELEVDRVLEGVMESARSVLFADGYAIWDQGLLGSADGSDALVDEADNAADRWIRRAGHGIGFTPTHVSGNAAGSSAVGHKKTMLSVAPREVEILQRVVREQSPLVVANTSHSPLAASLPTGSHKGDGGGRSAVRALLALPLVYGGKTTGVMALYYRSPHTFIPDEVGLAQSFAHQAANALENARIFTELRRLYAREKRIAEELQRSLLPPIPPEVGRFHVAYRYQAGLDEAAIGGDFLDLFPVGPQTMALVIADVSGKGLPAAVQTAMIKYTLRAFASEDPSNPARVLHRVNNALCNPSTAIQGFVTLFYGVLDTQTGVLVYGNAGHELPLLCDGETGLVCALPVADGIALGCMPEMDFQNRTVVLSPGNTLLLYTDGLTEARSEANDFLGLDGLRRMVSCSEGDADDAIQVIYDRVKAHAGEVLRDDVAMLLVKRNAT